MQVAKQLTSHLNQVQISPYSMVHRCWDRYSRPRKHKCGSRKLIFAAKRLCLPRRPCSTFTRPWRNTGSSPPDASDQIRPVKPCPQAVVVSLPAVTIQGSVTSRPPSPPCQASISPRPAYHHVVSLPHVPRTSWPRTCALGN
ncbi:hypothetical protein BV22DRAFT_934419 [Leucogyrophana mollusca]|uniref:Uncharacterized protein n=1 Tax=Leucogyrophana mollusca TaxID=85980 RepID=A0ACB8AVZ7_9AGAM|nr:hypothetical protein BV22DRAFT_934419 [Leucogyrophana mollusca]